MLVVVIVGIVLVAGSLWYLGKPQGDEAEDNSVSGGGRGDRKHR
jgi:hypothetical protein